MIMFKGIGELDESSSGYGTTVLSGTMCSS